MNKSEYQKYLASPEWASLKEQVRQRSRGKCERCKVGDHDVTHHLTYERLGHERLEDLLAVCEACRNFLSGRSHYDPAKKPRVDYGLHLVYVHLLPWMNFWWNTFSDPDSVDSHVLEFCIDIAATRLASGDDVSWEGECKFGSVPYGEYPATILWAGRSIEYSFARSKSIQTRTVIATFKRFSWVSLDPIILLVKAYLDGGMNEVEWENLTEEEKRELQDDLSDDAKMLR